MTEEMKELILDYYREGFSYKEIEYIFKGLDPREIRNICDEEDQSWEAN